MNRKIMILVVGLLLISANTLAVEYSPGYRVKTGGEGAGSGYNAVTATLNLSVNADLKGVAETGAAYNYLGIELPSGKSLEVGLTKDKYDLADHRWSVFAYANYEGAFSAYGTEGRWVNFRRTGAAFTGPQLMAVDGSNVTLSLYVPEKDIVVFEISGYEPLSLKMPGADPQGEKQIFRRVTSLMTDDPQGFFKNTHWSSVKIKKGQEPYTEWKPEPAEEWLSNNMDKNDPSYSWLAIKKDNENSQTINIDMANLPEQNTSTETMRVQFVGNQMYHNGRYLGFGISGKPMLSLRYLAERFGFQAAYDPQEGACIVSKGEYSFRIKPGSNWAEISWAGEKVKGLELSEKPLLRNKVLYLYSLDISDLLGLITAWDNKARTWDLAEDLKFTATLPKR